MFGGLSVLEPWGLWSLEGNQPHNLLFSYIWFSVSSLHFQQFQSVNLDYFHILIKTWKLALHFIWTATHKMWNGFSLYFTKDSQIVKKCPGLQYFDFKILYLILKKSRIRETPTLSTDADSRTDTILENLHDFFLRGCLICLRKKICYVNFFDSLNDFSQKKYI